MPAKSKDTTKTARVMNLLRKNSSSTQTAEPTVQQESSVEQGEPAVVQPKTLPPQHPIITSLNEEATVSQEIKDALEQELLDSEPSVPEVQQEPEEVKQASVHVDQMPVVVWEEFPEEPDGVSALPQEQEEAPSEVEVKEVQESGMAKGPAVESVLLVTEAPHERHIPVPNVEIYNVMQALVEDCCERYMDMFQLCTCPRCKADVMALALNNLQPKYVVMGEDEYIPRTTVYERQFNTTVTAQILRACTSVSENPRHKKLQ